jgi:hypothetical protein
VNGVTTAVAVGDGLEAAASGALVKVASGTAVAVATAAVTTDGATIEVISI